MHDDLRADLIAHFLESAEDAARRREWSEVLDLAEDILILDQDHAGALTLRTLAERYVERGQPEWGRRHETILFADLVGSTDLANRFDPEFVRRLVRSYELACTPVLSSLGGHAHRFLGDGILASFGYPTAHEDDARRAVQAGLDLVNAIAATSEQHRGIGAELKVKVGIASGIVVHCNRGGGLWTQTGDLFGTAVNLAARIQDLAKPGQVLISASTATLVEGFFDLESGGLRRLKGFDQPVAVYRVLRRTAATGWADRHGDVVSPFIGREAELGLLEHRFGAVSSRQVSGHAAAVPRLPGAVLITGDPGVGKTRLSHELIGRTADQERVVVELQCSSYRTSSPLYPVRAAIERYSEIEPGDDDEVRREKLAAVVATPDAMPYLALLLGLDLGANLPRPELTPMQLREVTLGYLYGWIKTLSERRPLILLIEDVHWADPTTCDLIERVATADLSGLLTVVTSRSVPGWIETAGFNHLRLGPISREEARALARCVGGDGLPVELVEEIASRSDGIPLFVEQLADSLKVDGDVAARRASIPSNLTELLQARLDAVGPSKRIAQLAAIIGREFEPELLGELARDLYDGGDLGSLDRPLEEHLERLIEGRLIEAKTGDDHWLRFRHALVSQAAYESQLMEERVERHSALAELLLRGGTNGRASDPAVIAFHFDRAERPTEAVTQYLAAAAQAQAVGALTEVMTHVARADELLGVVDEAMRAPLELSICFARGVAASAAGGYGTPTAVEDFTRSVELCGELKDIPGMGAGVLKALLGLWCYYYSTGELTKSEGVTAAMEKQLEVVTMPAGRPSYHACKGVELFCMGDLPRSEQHLLAAVELFADDDVDPADWALPNDPLAAVYAFLAPLRLFQGHEDLGISMATLGVDRSLHLEFPRGPFTVAFVRAYEAWMHRERGAFPEAFAAAEEVVRLGELHGFFDWSTAGRMQIAAAAIAMNPTFEGLDELTRAIAAFRVGGEEWILSSLQLEQGWGYLALGDLDSAEACLHDAEEVISHGQHTSLAEAHRLRAEILVRRQGADLALVAAELCDGMRFALGQGAQLFVMRCGASYERWLGLDGLDADLQAAYEHARLLFAADSTSLERFLRTCGPTAAVTTVGV